MENNHSERKHSWLSPSGMQPIVDGCVGKPRMEKGLPDKSNPAAERGTRIHEFAERLFKEPILIQDRVPEPFEWDMEEYEEAKAYVEYVKKISATLPAPSLFYTELDVEVFPELEIRGHVDNALYNFSEGVLHICDLKTGTTKVNVLNNPQLLLYAEGTIKFLNEKAAWYNISEVMDVKKVVTHVFQYGTGYSAEYAYEEFCNQIQKIRSKAKEAFDIYNRESEVDITELKENKSCIWCKAKRNCPLMLKSIREKAQINLAQLEVISDESPQVTTLPSVEMLSDEQKIKIIKYKKMIEAFIEDVEVDLMDRLEKGEVIEGVTIKQGKEVREWLSPAVVEKELRDLGVKPYEEKLITITKAEKLLGKGKLEGLTQLKKQKSSLQLVK